MSTWTDRTGHARQRSFTDAHGNLWIEQNPAKRTKWAKLARDGHAVAWEFAHDSDAYSGQLLIDGDFYTAAEATKKFRAPKT